MYNPLNWFKGTIIHKQIGKDEAPFTYRGMVNRNGPWVCRFCGEGFGDPTSHHHVREWYKMGNDVPYHIVGHE